MVDGLAEGVTAEALRVRRGELRRYERILSTDDYEVWLIAWAPTGACHLHDHGGSGGALRVVAGNLLEAATDLVDRRPLQTVSIAPGEYVAFGAQRVHEVWNPGPAPALSVHAYSPPLSTMQFYDARPARFLAPLRIELATVAP